MQCALCQVGTDVSLLCRLSWGLQYLILDPQLLIWITENTLLSRLAIISLSLLYSPPDCHVPLQLFPPKKLVALANCFFFPLPGQRRVARPMRVVKDSNMRTSCCWRIRDSLCHELRAPSGWQHQEVKYHETKSHSQLHWYIKVGLNAIHSW